MIGAFVLKTAVYLASLLVFYLPDGSTLPTIGGFDVDTSLTNVFGTLRGIIGQIPPFEVIFNAVVWYYGALILIMMIGWLKWLIGLIRGSGS